MTHAKTHVTCHKQPEVADTGNYITQCLNTQKLWPVPYSRIFTSVRKKLNNFALKIKKRFDERWVLADLYQMQAALSNNISISSAIWQVLLVTDSLRDSACVKGAHRYKFKDQMCCPGYQRRSNTDEIMKSSFSCHRNCLLCGLSICHLVNGSLVIFQPSPVVSTNVVPLASPAISNTGMSQSELRCIRLFYYAAGTYAIYFRNPGTLETIDVSWHMLRPMWLVTKQSVWTLRNFGRYSRIFSRLSERNYTNNFAQRIRRKMWYEMVFGRLAPTGRCTVKRHLNLLSHLASIASHRFTSGLRLCLRRSSAQVQPRLLEQGRSNNVCMCMDVSRCIYAYNHVYTTFKRFFSCNIALVNSTVRIYIYIYNIYIYIYYILYLYVEFDSFRVLKKQPKIRWSIGPAFGSNTGATGSKSSRKIGGVGSWDQDFQENTGVQKFKIIWGFPKMVVPNNHGFSFKKWSFWGVLGVPPFKETPIYILKLLEIKSNRYQVPSTKKKVLKKHQSPCTERLLVRERVTVGNCVEAGTSSTFCPGGVSCRGNFHELPFLPVRSDFFSVELPQLLFHTVDGRNPCTSWDIQNPSKSVRFSISTAAGRISEASTAWLLKGPPTSSRILTIDSPPPPLQKKSNPTITSWR